MNKDAEVKRLMALLNMQAMVSNHSHEVMYGRDEAIDLARVKDMAICEGPSPAVQAMIDQHRTLGSLRDSSLCYEMPLTNISEVYPRSNDRIEDVLVLGSGNMAEYMAQVKLNNMMLGHGYTDVVKQKEPKKAQGSGLLLNLMQRI